jgi:hypothetical protein
MKYNIYWIENGEQCNVLNANQSISLRLVKSLMEDGLEITGIINSEDDK